MSDIVMPKNTFCAISILFLSFYIFDIGSYRWTPNCRVCFWLIHEDSALEIHRQRNNRICPKVLSRWLPKRRI